MADEFNRQAVIKNLMTLIQSSCMKIGDVEKQLGVSVGYLSRLNKKENESALSAEFIWKISKLFGVSVDTLVSEDLEQEDKMASYMRKFIAKLSEKTTSGELVWAPITISQINNMLMGNCQARFPVAYYRNAHFPEQQPSPSTDPTRVDNALSCYDHMKVVSAVSGGIMVNPQGSVYYTTIGEGPDVKEIYLACYCTESDVGSEEFFELMLLDSEAEAQWWDNQETEYRPVNGKAEIPPYVEEICNTYASVWQPIRNELRDLYRTVKGHENDIQLSRNVKCMIDQFMTEDELPF